MWKRLMMKNIILIYWTVHTGDSLLNNVGNNNVKLLLNLTLSHRAWRSLRGFYIIKLKYQSYNQMFGRLDNITSL